MKRLLTILLILCILSPAVGQVSTRGTYDPGAARSTLSNVDPATGRAALGLDLRLDTINASFTGNIDVTGDVGAATVNGVAPLTAAEKTQALVGSITVDFVAQGIKTRSGSVNVDASFMPGVEWGTTRTYAYSIGSLTGVGSNTSIVFACSSDAPVFVKTTVTGFSAVGTPIAKVVADSFYLTPASSLTGGTQTVLVDHGASQTKINIVWAWQSAGYFKVTITNAGASDFKEGTVAIEFVSSRVTQFTKQ